MSSTNKVKAEADHVHETDSSNSHNEKSSKFAMYGTRFDRFIQQNILGFLALVGFFLGFILGISLKYSILFGTDYWTPRRIFYLRYPGGILVDMLLCISLPLTMSGVVAGIGSMDLKTFGYAIWRIVVYIVVTTLLAGFIGTFVTVIIHPGNVKDRPVHRICYLKYPKEQADNLKFGNATCSKDLQPCYFNEHTSDIWDWRETEKVIPVGAKITEPYCPTNFFKNSCTLSVDVFLDLIEKFVPDNIVNAFQFGFQRKTEFEFDDSKGTWEDDCLKYTLLPEPKPVVWDLGVRHWIIRETNYAGVYAFSILMGIAAICNADTGQPLLNIFTSLSQCTLKISTWIIWFSPVGICSLVTANIVDNKKSEVFNFGHSRNAYIFTCVLALSIYAFICLPLLYYAFVRKSPFQLYKRLLPAVWVGGGLKSSTGAIPLIIDNLEEQCLLDPRIVRFMVPLASQLNLDGSMITTVVAIVYSCQLNGVHIDTCKFFAIVFMSFASVSSTNSDYSIESFHRRLIPVFYALELPAYFVVYTIGLEYIIGHFRAMTNVLTHCVGCAIVDHLCAKQMDFEKFEEQNKDAAALVAAHAFAFNHKNILDYMRHIPRPVKLVSVGINVDLPEKPKALKPKPKNSGSGAKRTLRGSKKFSVAELARFSRKRTARRVTTTRQQSINQGSRSPTANMIQLESKTPRPSDTPAPGQSGKKKSRLQSKNLITSDKSPTMSKKRRKQVKSKDSTVILKSKDSIGFLKSKGSMASKSKSALSVDVSISTETESQSRRSSSKKSLRMMPKDLPN